MWCHTTPTCPQSLRLRLDSFNPKVPNSAIRLAPERGAEIRKLEAKPNLRITVRRPMKAGIFWHLPRVIDAISIYFKLLRLVKA